MSLCRVEAVECVDERYAMYQHSIRLVWFLLLLFDDVSYFQGLFMILKSQYS